MQKGSFLNRSFWVVALLVLLVPIAVVSQPHTYTVSSSVSGGLGMVALTSVSGTTYLNVPGTGNYVTQVPSTVTSVTINGYTAYYPTVTDIVLPNGNPGRVTFTSTTSVVVMDLLEGA